MEQSDSLYMNIRRSPLAKEKNLFNLMLNSGNFERINFSDKKYLASSSFRIRMERFVSEIVLDHFVCFSNNREH